MGNWARKEAVFWLSPYAIHIIKKEYDWLRRCRMVLGDTYADIPDRKWLEKRDILQSVFYYLTFVVY